MKMSAKRNLIKRIRFCKMLKSVFVTSSVASIFGMLGVIGTSDLEDVRGIIMHSDTWYFTSTLLLLVIAALSIFISIKLSDYIDYINNRLEKVKHYSIH